MARRLRSHVAGNLVGYVALFVSLSGVAYAATSLPPGSVGSRQLKRAAVTRAKLAAGVVNASKVAANSLTGRQINAATLGTVPSATTAATATEAGAAGTATRLGSVTLVRADGAALAPNGVESESASCPAGEQPIGGGGRADASNPRDAIISSRPSVPGNTTEPTTGSTLEGWQVTVVNNSTTDIHPSTWVICTG
jgi:hypothetical protein